MTTTDSTTVIDVEEFTAHQATEETVASNSSNGCSVYVSTASEEMDVMSKIHWGLPILVTLTVCSLLTIGLFFHSLVNIRRHVPYGNRRIFLVRLSGLFPVFSGTSLAGFFVPKASLIANWGASLYLSTTLYIFVLLIVDYYGGIEKMERHLEGATVSLSAPPLTCCCPCLPHINFSMKNFHRFRRLVLQAAYIRPICVFLAAVLWADGIYQPSVIKPDSAYLYLNIISLVSSIFAVYALSVIYNGSKAQLQHFMVGVKFAVIKCVLILTNGQNVIIAILIMTNVIPCVGPLDSAVRGELMYNMLVVCEMFLLAILFKCYYWRWTHEYGHKFALAASVGDNDLEEGYTTNASTYSHIPDLQGKTSASDSLSNVSKTGSSKCETEV